MYQKIVTTILFISLTIGGFSQGSMMSSERRFNPYLQSDNWPYRSVVFVEKNMVDFEIDTFNVCRIQKCKIKSVTAYYFEGLKDSVQWRKRGFNAYGICPYRNNGLYTKTDPKTIKIDCSLYDLNYKSNRRGTVKDCFILIGDKIIEKYDSLGYLIEHTTITKGILMRWLAVNAFGGTAKFHRFYSYSDGYKKVKCTWCFKDKLKTENCSTKLVTFFQFDENRNLLSETQYRENEKGKLVFEEGFKYYYEYYE